LARISVGVNASTITNANITDLRTSTGVAGAVRTLLGGDPTSTSGGDGYRIGEMRFRKAAGGLPDLLDYFGTDGLWHPLNDTMVCRAQLASSFSLGANSDVYAQTGWNIVEDPYSMAHISGSVGTLSYIQVPFAGRYVVSYQSSMTSVSGGTVLSEITVNGQSTSVARDNRAGVNAGGDGTWTHAHREVQLSAGDKLYWGNWSSISTTVAASFFGLSTEMYVRRIGN
jgi:hypothetical protein